MRGPVPTIRVIQYGRDRLTTALAGMTEALAEGLRAPGNHRRVLKTWTSPPLESPEHFWEVLFQEKANDEDSPPLITVVSGHGGHLGEIYQSSRGTEPVDLTAPPRRGVLQTSALLVNTCWADEAADAWRDLLADPDSTDLVLGADQVGLPDASRWVAHFLLAVAGLPGEYVLSPEARGAVWERVVGSLAHLERSPRSPVLGRFVVFSPASSKTPVPKRDPGAELVPAV